MPQRRSRTVSSQTTTDIQQEKTAPKKLRRKIPAPKKKSTPTVPRKPRTKKSPAPRNTNTSTQSPELTTRESTPERSVFQQAKRCAMTTNECFVYGGVVCLVGTIVLGLLLGLVVLPPVIEKYEQSRFTYAAPVSAEDPTSLPLPSSAQKIGDLPESSDYGFYGTLLSKDAGVLTIKELLPPLPLEDGAPSGNALPRTFVVRVSDATAYTHQRPRDNDNTTAPLFSPEEGLFDNLKKDMFVFVNTKDNPDETETMGANHVLYSELSPFAE